MTDRSYLVHLRRADGPLALLVLLGVVLLLRATVASPVRVSSESMRPTFAAGDVVLVTRQPPRIEDLERGDLVTLADPDDARHALKRVVGLPGEDLVIKDSVLHIDGRVVHESYVDHALIDGYYSRTYQVPEDAVFVLGDNRGNSIDSRDYGAVPGDALLGRVMGRLWPLQPRGR